MSLTTTRPEAPPASEGPAPVQVKPCPWGLGHLCVAGASVSAVVRGLQCPDPGPLVETLQEGRSVSTNCPATATISVLGATWVKHVLSGKGSLPQPTDRNLLTFLGLL